MDDTIFQVLGVMIPITVILIEGFRRLGNKIDKTDERMIDLFTPMIADIAAMGPKIEATDDKVEKLDGRIGDLEKQFHAAE